MSWELRPVTVVPSCCTSGVRNLFCSGQPSVEAKDTLERWPSVDLEKGLRVGRVSCFIHLCSESGNCHYYIPTTVTYFKSICLGLLLHSLQSFPPCIPTKGWTYWAFNEEHEFTPNMFLQRLPASLSQPSWGSSRFGHHSLPRCSPASTRICGGKPCATRSVPRPSQIPPVRSQVEHSKQPSLEIIKASPTTQA